ncbi:MAG: PEP-CTERM sorting domain-containing protein [Phycisphaerae bacterium]|jgi:hypothetical protein
MKKNLFAAFLILAASNFAFAGFVEDTFLCTFPDDPDELIHTWTFDYGTYDLNLAEHLTVLGNDQVVMSGETDEDPIYRTIKCVTNGSGVAWTSYELTLSATGPTFTGTPSADLFSSAVISDGGLKITFSGGVVNPDDEVLLNFRILVPTTGAFSVCLTQTPIPEPATMALLGLGALALIRKK